MTNPATKSVDAYLKRQRAYWARHPVSGKPRLELMREVIDLDLKRAKADLREAEERRDMKAWGG